jgi:predicted DNA-binding protein (UPF0251 family)
MRTAQQDQHALPPRQRLRSLRARRELLHIEQDEALQASLRDGLSQREIASFAGISQPTVQRILQRIRRDSATAASTTTDVRRLILRHAAQEISEQELVAALSTRLVSGELSPASLPDGYIPGSWDEVRSAFLDGLLDEDLYETLRNMLQSPS